MDLTNPSPTKGVRMMATVFQRAAAFFMCVLLSGLLPPVRAPKEARMRALLIGCDHFVTRESTAPYATMNVSLLASALATDSRGYQVIRTEADSITGLDTLERAVAETFLDAGEGDVSLIYISTHGLYSPQAPLSNCALVFSDGADESIVTAPELKNLLDTVPGLKIVILDACTSGAFIGKGLRSVGRGSGVFQDPDYRVLCSAGGSEESWYWHSEDDSDPGTQYGASYFATVLASVFEPGTGADGNRDGAVTLQEAYAYLGAGYAASTPQVYPQDDRDTVLYACPQGRNAPSGGRIIRDLQLNGSVVTASDPSVRFTFTQLESGTVYYQLIYRSQGAWDFGSVQMISDMDAAPDAGTPGLKERSLAIGGLNGQSYGYVMLLLVTRPSGHAEMQASALISVQPEDAENTVSCVTDPSFAPDAGRECAILVRHTLPCSLSVSVLNGEGRSVRMLSYSLPSRPQSFQGSTFSWDGRMNDLSPAPAGNYTVKVTATTGGRSVTVLSRPLTLLRAAEEAGDQEP